MVRLEAATVSRSPGFAKMLTFVAGVLLGGVVGVIFTIVLQPPLERGYGVARDVVRRKVLRPAAPAEQDLETLGFHQLLSWSSRRPLDPSLHRVVVDRAEPVRQQWFDEDLWVAERNLSRAAIQGEVTHISGYTVDHGEAGPESLSFELTVRPCLYADGVAVQRLLEDDRRWEQVRQLFVTMGARAAVAVGPPQSFFVALSLLTSDGQCLAFRRASGAVATGGGLWSLGACETMGAIPTRTGYEPESLFELAYRAAREELGLDRADLGPVWFTWFGYARLDGPMAIAHVRTELSSAECMQRLAHAEGRYEADAIRWIGIDSAELDRLATTGLHANWLPFTCIVARDLKAVNRWLDTEPSRHR